MNRSKSSGIFSNLSAPGDDTFKTKVVLYTKHICMDQIHMIEPAI